MAKRNYTQEEGGKIYIMVGVDINKEQAKTLAAGGLKLAGDIVPAFEAELDIGEQLQEALETVLARIEEDPKRYAVELEIERESATVAKLNAKIARLRKELKEQGKEEEKTKS